MSRLDAKRAGIEPDRSFHAIEHPRYPLTLGAILLSNARCRFRVWASKAKRAQLHLVEPEDQIFEMERCERGYFELTVDDVEPGALYYYRLDGGPDVPDPASRCQPRGVHEPSEVTDPGYDWHDHAWHGLPLPQYVIYELHVGTFTEEGTFEAIISHLDELKRLGITAIELMPISQFPGDRNWGYDGVHHFAAQNTYGGPDGLKRLVDCCHERGIAVILDVVYNHFGPEGNYLASFSHYFLGIHRTPWGDALNFDGRDSDEVRRFFIENALYWISECHIDALRLDAVHAIFDQSAYPFLRELADVVHEYAEQLNRHVHLIAESNLNDTKLLRSSEVGGFGLDAQWSDDFHHAVHTLLTGEKDGYYADFGEFEHLVKAYRERFVFSGDYSPFRRRRFGDNATDMSPAKFVISTQTHDQIGNRKLGERLSDVVDFEDLKLAAGLMLLSPYTPMLFMGEEYAETAPFQYFISHIDERLVEAVRKGRKEEFADFSWHDEPPDPQSQETFERCRLNHDLKWQGKHAVLYRLYGELIHLRKTLPALAWHSLREFEVDAAEEQQVMTMRRWTADEELFAVFNIAPNETQVRLRPGAGTWTRLFDSAEAEWLGPGSPLESEVEVPQNGRTCLTLAPRSFALYRRERA